MMDHTQSVKPFTYAEPNYRRAKIRYLLALRGIRVNQLYSLLSQTPSFPMLCMVCNATKKSAPLEQRIADVLGVSRDELFGDKKLDVWRVA